MSELHDAAYKGKSEAVRLLLDRGADLNPKSFNGNTPLHEAACEGHTETVRLLLDRGADVNAKDHDGETPLHMPARQGHTETVKLLLDRGADVNAKGEGKGDAGTTPLHLAAYKGRTKTAKLLLDRGANVNAKDRDGETPLHTAATEVHTEVVKLLLDRGADVNAKGTSGNTPMYYAARLGHTDTVKLLLDRGADVNVRDKDGHTPLYAAQSRKHTEVARLLRDAGAARLGPSETARLLSATVVEGVAAAAASFKETGTWCKRMLSRKPKQPLSSGSSAASPATAGEQSQHKKKERRPAASQCDAEASKNADLDAAIAALANGNDQAALAEIGTKIARSAFEKHVQRLRSELKSRNMGSGAAATINDISTAFERSAAAIGTRVVRAVTGESSYFSVDYHDLGLRLDVTVIDSTPADAYKYFARFGGYLEWLANEALSLASHGSANRQKTPVFAHLIFVLPPEHKYVIANMCIAPNGQGDNRHVPLLLPADLMTKQERKGAGV